MALITLNTLVNIYQKPDSKGIQKLVKRNVKCKKIFETNNLQIEEYIKPNGEVSKRFCSIKEGDNYYTIAHSFEYVEKLISPIYIKGYKRW